MKNAWITPFGTSGCRQFSSNVPPGNGRHWICSGGPSGIPWKQQNFKFGINKQKCLICPKWRGCADGVAKAIVGLHGEYIVCVRFQRAKWLRTGTSALHVPLAHGAGANAVNLRGKGGFLNFTVIWYHYSESDQWCGFMVSIGCIPFHVNAIRCGAVSEGTNLRWLFGR